MFRHIQPPLSDDIYTQMHLVIDDLNNLEKQLSERKDAKPNCRPVTPEELAALRASSNVFAFRPAA